MGRRQRNRDLAYRRRRAAADAARRNAVAISRAQRLVEENANRLVPFMLMAAYAYYHTDHEMVPDWLFDEWYARLKRTRWRIKHPHLHLINTRGAGSGGCVLGIRKYPSIVIGALGHWRERYG